MSLFARVGDFKVNNFFVFLSYIKLQRSPPQSSWVCLGDLNFGAVSKARQPSSAAWWPGRKEKESSLPGNQTGRGGGGGRCVQVTFIYCGIVETDPESQMAITKTRPY